MTPHEAATVVPEAIERELNRLEWTWYRLGKETGISHATLSNIRNGYHEAKASNLKTIADKLGVTVDSLLVSANSTKSKNSRRAAASVA